MSEHPLPDDELLSSHLDGELAADEQTRLDQRLTDEPALRRRLDDLRAAAALAGSPVAPLASADAGRMIEAALAASATAGNVTDLSTARERRRVWPTRVATAAAGVVALALSVSVLGSLDQGGSDDADSASTADAGDSARTEATFDESADDTAGADMEADLSQEAVIGPPDAATGVMDGASNDSDASDEGADSPDTAALAHSRSRLRLFVDDASFDPLADDLGDYDETGELAVDLSTQWTAFVATRTAITSTTSAGEPEPEDGADADAVESTVLFDAASVRLDGFGFEACPEFAELVIDYFVDADEAVTAADYARATDAGAPVAIGVFELPGGQAVGLVVDLSTCEIRDVPLG